MKTYEQFITNLIEAAGLNKGMKREKSLTSGLKRLKRGGPGSSSSGRGSDGVIGVYHRGSKKPTDHTLEIKGKGSAYGQIRFHYDHDGGWHYRATEKPSVPIMRNISGMNAKKRKQVEKQHAEKMKSHDQSMSAFKSSRKISKRLNRSAARRALNAFYGKPKDTSKAGLIKHVQAVHAKHGGEFVHHIDSHPDHVVKLLHDTMNNNDLVDKEGKGTYAFKRSLARKTGIPALGDHIERGSLKLRHRTKVRNRNERGGTKTGAGTTLTAQVNLDDDGLRRSDIDGETHALGKKSKIFQ